MTSNTGGQRAAYIRRIIELGGPDPSFMEYEGDPLQYWSDAAEFMVEEYNRLQSQVDALQQKVHLCAGYDELQSQVASADTALANYAEDRKAIYAAIGIEERHAAEVAVSEIQRLQRMCITHPTDICECRFDFTDGDMTVRNVCGYHQKQLDRLSEIEKQAGDATEYVLAQINAELRTRLEASADWKQRAIDERVRRVAAESRLDRSRSLLAMYLSEAPHEDGCDEFDGGACTCCIGPLDRQASALLESAVEGRGPLPRACECLEGKCMSDLLPSDVECRQSPIPYEQRSAREAMLSDAGIGVEEQFPTFEPQVSDPGRCVNCDRLEEDHAPMSGGCKTPADAGQELEDGMWRCPKCGKANGATSQSCARCPMPPLPEGEKR